MICWGLVRGITFSVRHSTNRIAPKKMIIRTGCQFSAQFWISWANEVFGPDATGTVAIVFACTTAACFAAASLNAV